MNLTVGIHDHAHEMAAVTGIGQRFSQSHGADGRPGLTGTLPASEGRPYEQQEGDKGGNRIARQAKEKFARMPAKSERPAGADGDFPKIQLAAELPEGVLDEIGFADGYTAGGNEHVALGEGILQSGYSIRQSVVDERQDFGNSTGPGDEGSEGGAITFMDFSGRKRLSSLDKFRAGRKQTHDGTTSGPDLRQPGSREQAKARRAEGVAGFAQQGVPFQILAAQADIFPGPGRFKELNDLRLRGVNSRVFLHYNRVSAAWQR